ncbi:unnamed protein product [Auanema sp. JU1783]|nr:unnamed protein product [Auanema sp. JU1783]
MWGFAVQSINELIEKYSINVELHSHVSRRRFAWNLSKEVGKLFSVFEACHNSFYTNANDVGDLKTKVLYRGSDGNSHWKETSQLTLPKGQNTLSFKAPSLIIFAGCLGVFVYAQFQETVNPNSTWGVLYRRLVTDPLKWLGADKTEGQPIPGPSSHLK